MILVIALYKKILSSLRSGSSAFVITLLALFPQWAGADTLDSGDTAWMLTATTLVLFMTLPGLALFYGGLSVAIWCAVVSFILLKLIDKVIGLRVDEDEETEGLDLVLHDERGYNL